MSANARSSQDDQGNDAPRVGMALRDTFREGYGWTDLRADILAGITVGVVAVPLAMALAIAVGMPPQHGLYTAIVAGALIAITGGSRFNVSGPTAAFVVILLPITNAYGPGGLLIATAMSGAILVIMGLTRLGQLVQYVPYPVIVGFTAGVAVVVAGLQLEAFLGLNLPESSAQLLVNLRQIITRLHEVRLPDLGIGLLTVAVLLGWNRLGTKVPGHLVALVVSGLVAFVLAQAWAGLEVATIKSQFSYMLNGEMRQGIPAMAPSFLLPWKLADASGQPIGLSFELIRSLLGPALAIAMLAAIESLLCAVVADGLTGTRHRPNSELIGQGLGNIVAPFFGGITGTAAIARTAANVRSGARSPIAAIIHSLVIVLALVALAGLLGSVPMAALAALLLVVAWNISEAGHFLHLLRRAPRDDILVLLTCFGLTVLVDMVIAVGVGVGLSALLFIRHISRKANTSLVPDAPRHLRHPEDMPTGVAVYDINGPLFFGAAEKAMHVLRRVDQSVRVMVLDMADVPALDLTAIIALEALLQDLRRGDVRVVITNLSPEKVYRLRRAGIRRIRGQLTFTRNLVQARRMALAYLALAETRGTPNMTRGAD